jgi:hypothetical protein
MPTFKGNNDLGARDIWIHRSVYDGYALAELRKVKGLTLETLQIKDFRKNEKIFVGRVNEQFDPVFPRPRYIKTVNNKPLVSFVADAYSDMKKKFDTAVRQGYISRSGPLGDLKIVKGYSDPLMEYSNYLAKIKDDFRAFVRRKNRINKIRNFETMVPIFMEFAELVTSKLPLTRSMFFMTRFMPPATSGLVFEVYSGDYGDDTLKIREFYRQRNFEYLKNLAYSFGFMIDKHIPWRLVADLNSPQMEPYIRKSLDIRDAGSGVVFPIAYKRTYPDDIPTIIRLLVEVYNDVVRFRPQTRIKQSSGTVNEYSGKSGSPGCRRVETIYRKPTTVERERKNQSVGFWLDVYAKIRNHETGLKYDKQVLQEIINNATDLAKKLDNRSGLGYIISKFRSVAQYEGSLFYDHTRLRLAKQSDVKESDVAETVRRSVQASNYYIY